MTFFLSQFGLKLAKFDDDDSVETPLASEPTKQHENPKISPYGFEISDEPCDQIVNIDGERVFVRVKDDDDDASADWHVISIDDDGDPCVTINIDKQTWLAKEIYFKYKESLKVVPVAAKSIDDEDDLVLDMNGFVALHATFIDCVEFKGDPTSPGVDWYLNKLYCGSDHKPQINIAGTWHEYPFPFPKSCEIGYYSFK